ncbi:MAG TPA: xylulokinase [Eubacteriaceae bacterium]|nr:xylulokinase [Eubacteriaceae bacterium]
MVRQAKEKVIMSYYIGVDVGTSSVKILLINEVGEIINTIAKEYENISPATGWREQNPEVWFDNVSLGIKELMTGYESHEVDGIGVTGQMHTTVFLDKEGKSIRPAILWNDTRTYYLVDELKRKVKDTKEISYLKGIVSTGSHAANLLWMKENEKENFNKINRVLTPKDYIVYRLTGCIATDYCDASTSALFDFKQRTWSEKMKEIIGIGDILPDIKNSSDIVGVIEEDLAAKLNLNNNIKVIAGTGDNAASSISTDNIRVGSATLSLGTSGVIFVPCKNSNFKSRIKNILFSISEDHTVNLMQGTVRSAAACNKWWIEDILGSKDFGAEQDNIKADNLGNNNLLFFPHLTGDKLVYGDTLIKGSFLGISIDTTREQMTQAVLEGVAFALKDVLNMYKSIGINIDGVRVTGGGSKSDLWIKIISNVLGITLKKQSSYAGPGYGVGMLAMYGCGEYGSIQEIIDMNVCVKEKAEPEILLTRLYEEKYGVYKRIYPALKDIFEEI